MKIRRETLAFFVGTAACLLAGFLPWCEVPSAAKSWVGSDDILHITYDECGAGFAARTFLLGFSILSMTILLVRRISINRLRYVAYLVLFVFMLIPQILTTWSPGTVKDAQVVYDEVEIAIADMEISLNQQQEDWRKWQKFNEGVLSAARSINAPDSSFLSFDDLGWSGIPAVVERALGYSNALLNLFGKGYYLGCAGLVCWLLGAYSGDRTAARRRSKDLVAVPLAAVVVLLVLLTPRMMASVYVDGAVRNAALGKSRAATIGFERASALEPLSEFSLFRVSQSNVAVGQLFCNTCPELALLRASAAIATGKDYATAILYLESVVQVGVDLPGLRYWTSTVHVLNGFMQFNAGQYSAADSDFARGLELVPTDALAWYGRAMVQKKLGDFARSAKFLENAVAIQSRLNFKRLTLKGQLYLTRSWRDFRSNDLVSAHENYSRYMTPESW